MGFKSIMRIVFKFTIISVDAFTRWIPGFRHDIVILKDFKDSDKYLQTYLDEEDVKTISNHKLTSYIAAFYVRRAKYVYVDNINIVIGSLNNIEARVIQYWHASSAMKKFGLATVSNTTESAIRKKELNNYDIITVNSDYMSEKFQQCFGVCESKINKIGCVHSKSLFKIDIIKPYFEYIVYVPTFRFDNKFDKKAIDFIKHYKSDKYKLIYSLHPKLDIEINNEDTIAVNNRDIRSYFANASVVISDYSSLLIDASLNCSQTIMYAYDFDCYSKYPGVFIDKNNFWGFYTESEQELLEYINECSFKQHDKEYIRKTFFQYDDDQSAERIANLSKNEL